MKYDLLLSFGCSFTEGGGLNDPRYHQYIRSNLQNQDLDSYMLHHSYPGYLSRMLNCDFINYGISCAGNELIFRTVYEKCKNLSKDQKILVTVQTSILSRILLNSADNDSEEFIINTDLGQPMHIAEYYRTYIQRFYNQQKEFKKLLQQVDLLQSWLREKSIDFVFIAWESQGDVPDNLFCHSGIDNGSFSKFIEFNKTSICDLPNIPYVDMHATEQGNSMIAEKILNHIRKIND